MTTLPLRHPKLMAALLAMSVLTTLYDGTYFAFLKHWLPYAGLLVFMSFITPVNRLKSLNPFHRTLVAILGVVLIVEGVFELSGPHPAFLDFLHSAFRTAKSYLP